MSEQPPASDASSPREPPRLRSPDRQSLIPPMPLEDLLDSDHQIRVVWDFCLGLDLTPLLDEIRSRVGGPGRAALDPRLGVALWLYATLEGVGSARALDYLCVEHNAFRWLTTHGRPAFRHTAARCSDCFVRKKHHDGVNADCRNGAG